MLRRLIGEDVTVSTLMAPDLDNVLIDPSQIEQVILNLSLNARTPCRTGGRLGIETRNAVARRARGRPHPGRRPGRYVDSPCRIPASA